MDLTSFLYQNVVLLAVVHPFKVSTAVLTLYTVSYILTALYRFTLHPLASFPGPRQAAISNRWLYKQLKNRHPEETFEALHRHYRESLSPI